MVIDKDQDGLLSREDMYNMLDMITDEPLKENVKKKVVDEVRKSVVFCFFKLVHVYGGSVSGH